LAEFAIVFPVLFLIIAGIVQFGIIFWGQNSLNQVVRDTGRWAATMTACAGAEPSVRSTANSIADASSLIGYTTGSWGPADIDVSFPGPGPCPPLDNGDVAWVKITIRHSVPIFFPLVPGNGEISSSTQFRMEPTPP
jgi:hypothetical protein